MLNPVVNGWYADPESRVYGDAVYMYVTKSLPFDEQRNLELLTTAVRSVIRILITESFA